MFYNFADFANLLKLHYHISVGEVVLLKYAKEIAA